MTLKQSTIFVNIMDRKQRSRSVKSTTIWDIGSVWLLFFWIWKIFIVPTICLMKCYAEMLKVLCLSNSY